MNDTVDLLQKLQDLEIVLRESQIVHGNTGDEGGRAQVDLEAKELRSEIDQATLARYDRMSRQGLCVVHERKGMCLGCNLAIPQGDLNRMIRGEMRPCCPHCDRFLILESLDPDK